MSTDIGDAFAIDGLGGGGVAMGNLVSSATLGAALRWGWHLPQDFAMATPWFRDTAIGLRSWDPVENRRPAVYCLATAAGSLIAHAIELDGNSVGGAHGVPYDRTTIHLALGINAAYREWIAGISVEQWLATWDHPDPARWQRFGRATIGWSF
jgi:lipid A 3-O-deacylase